MAPPIDPASDELLSGVFAPGWNHALDILVVLGNGAPEFYDAVASAGQARVVEVSAPDSPAPAVPRVSDALGLFHAILDFPGSPATNASFRRLAGVELSQEQLDELTDALRGAVSSQGIYQRGVDHHAPRWAHQGIANLARIAELPSAQHLFGGFAGVPCVIASPGPSLARNVEQLGAVTDRAVVMTCSHALRALERAGVTPHVVCISDPTFTGHHFDDCDLGAVPAFFFDAALSPRNFELPAQRIFTFSTHAAVDQWIFGALGETAHVDTGGSVACAELSLALAMGCDPIVFIGQDLALTDGQYYAATSVDGGVKLDVSEDGRSFEVLRPARDTNTGEHSVVRHPTEGMYEVPAWGGGTVLTSESLGTFLQWFRVAARSAPATLYNCTEGGAFIDGMQHRPLADVLGALTGAPLDVPARLDELARRGDVPRRRARMHAAVGEMIAGLESCVREARECASLASRAASDASALNSLSAAEGRLSRALAPLSFVSMLAQPRIRAAQEEGVEARTLEDNLAVARRIFEVVEEAGDGLLPLLHESREALGD